MVCFDGLFELLISEILIIHREMEGVLIEFGQKTGIGHGLVLIGIAGYHEIARRTRQLFPCRALSIQTFVTAVDVLAK